MRGRSGRNHDFGSFECEVDHTLCAEWECEIRLHVRLILRVPPLPTLTVRAFACVVDRSVRCHTLGRRPDYSITSSASAITVGGTVKPSVIAVLKLMANSNLAGACAGSSAGLAPFKMRSTYEAERRKISDVSGVRHQAAFLDEPSIRSGTVLPRHPPHCSSARRSGASGRIAAHAPRSARRLPRRREG